MDAFLEPFWNLDQIMGWAETRDPEIIRAAAWPRHGAPKKTVEVAIRTTHMATAILRDGRDVGGELWAASGWTPMVSAFEPPKAIQEYAERRGISTYMAYRYKDLQVHWPRPPKSRELSRAWKFATEQDRALATEITLDHYEDASGILSDRRLNDLTPSLAQLLREVASIPAVQGPPHVYIRQPFRTLDYMEYLFQTGRFQAAGNRPNNPEATQIMPVDWGGLEIAVGGVFERLGVWLRGQVRSAGQGVFENVRVSREQILAEFPADPVDDDFAGPETVTDEDVRLFLRSAVNQNNGFIGQQHGAAMVRERFPSVTRDRARRLVKEVTGNEKPGPRGPRSRKRA